MRGRCFHTKEDHEKMKKQKFVNYRKLSVTQ